MVEAACRPGAFLDSVHVLALALALRRPIIILASPMQQDPWGKPLAPIFFRGVYLPFGQPPEHCCRQPLILCFQDAHFMPLVPRDGVASPVRVPLADGNGEELPLRFAMEEELSDKWEIVSQYLDIERDVNLPRLGQTCNMALLQRGSSHPLTKEMVTQFVERGRVTFKTEQEEAATLKRNNPFQTTTMPVAKKQKQEEVQDSLRSEDDTLPATQPESGGLPMPAPPQESDVPRASWNPPVEQEPDSDEVSDTLDVTLPRGLRPGNAAHYQMPKGCTTAAGDRLQFKVPRSYTPGNSVKLTIRFTIKGRCIKALREVTGLPRDDAVQRLTKSHGDPDAAARDYFE